MEGIDVPMTRGSMNDVAQEVDTGASQTESTVDSMSTQGARQIYEREAHIVIDYGRLDEDYKDVCTMYTCVCLFCLPLYTVRSLIKGCLCFLSTVDMLVVGASWLGTR